MSIPPAPHQFAYLGGDPALDLINTVDWTRHGTVNEQLTAYDELASWAEGAGVIPKAVGAQLRRRAKRQPHGAARALAKALEIRAILQHVFARDVGAGARKEALNAYNGLLREAAQRLQLRAEGQASQKGAPGRMQWSWSDFGESLDSLLWPVVWSAAMLLASEEVARIRTCGGENCGWMYVDRSRNGLRRWCRMEICGTQAKSRRRRERNALA